MFRNSILPLTDTITTTYCEKTNKNYGNIRVIGSLFFAVASFLCGQLIKMTNNDLMFFYVFIVSMIGCLIITPTLPTLESNTKPEKVNLKQDLPLLFKNKAYLLILLCGICVNSLTEAMASYQGIHLMSLGAGPELVGNIGRKTAVANNDQIISGIESGVYRAMVAANSMKQGGSQTIRIINEIDGDVVGEKVIQYHNGKVMQTGVSPLLV